MHLTKEELTRLVGNEIRELRLMKKLSIEEVANEAGIEYTQLSRIELGKINTSIYQIYRIAVILDVEVHELFNGLNHQPG